MSQNHCLLIELISDKLSFLLFEHENIRLPVKTSKSEQKVETLLKIKPIDSFYCTFGQKYTMLLDKGMFYSL